ncbi:MAG: EthD domain-containing protein [Leucobacter sp.]
MLQSPVVRFGFLRRLPSLDHYEFARHWRTVHGPLVAGLEGFTTFTERYIQNHLIEGEDSSWIDGVSMTHQRAREDYSAGFFEHADVLHSQNDELHFLDTRNSEFYMGPRRVLRQSPEGAHKIIVLAESDAIEESVPYASRLSITRALDADENAKLCIVEAWFSDEDAATRVLQTVRRNAKIRGVVQVNEVQQFPKE